MSEHTEIKKSSAFREYAEALIWALALAFLIRTFVVQVYTVPTGSMLQTIQKGDFMLVNKFIYGIKIPFTDKHLFQLDGPERGDIIVFKFPQDTKQDFIKRVVGLPGDVLEMKDAKFYRNGQLVQEDYVQHTGLVTEYNNFGPITVPTDSYFVMGDNRDESFDSRGWGFVPRGYIHGKAWRFIWSWEPGARFIHLKKFGKPVK